MEGTVSPEPDAQSRRKSGRVVQKPVLFQEDPDVPGTANPSTKRKRGSAQGLPGTNGAGEDDAPDTEGSDDDAEEDDGSEPDEEQRARQRRRARTKKSKSKPAAKKPKVAQDGPVELTIRPAPNGVKKASKPRKPRAKPARRSGSDVDAGSGLYNEVFAQGKSSDEVATQWLVHYGENPVEAMRDFVNFVLKCTGCQFEVTNNDIEDVDNVAGKLTDLQDEFVAQKVTEYPLITRTKGSVFNKGQMVDFVETLLEAADQTEKLYDDIAMIENMQAWVTTMSSSSSRPFRHTSTVIGLAMGSALCSLNKQCTVKVATTGRQRDAEAKKKGANKERVKALQATLQKMEEQKALTEVWIKETFDGIFVHRYRDVDPKIRVDCAQILGLWINTCPDIFFVGEYLRYLGWVLSDVVPSTRIEVLKQLSQLYKDADNSGRLRAFTERFKPRMVEMASQDADLAVRALSIDLLDMIREMGFLEPEDIDSVGKLIFDSELRVRKAVTDFFSSNIDDVVEGAIEEIGGEETLNEALGEEDDKDYGQPKRSWLKYKSLAEVLEAYDADDADVAEAVALGADNLLDSGGGTRFSLAGDIACSGMPEVKEWESLAGYLLFDFSVPKGAAAKQPINVFKANAQPSEKQESILLEVLQVAVRLQIEEAVAAGSDRRGKPRVKADDARTLQENTAQSLSSLLPKLLSKYGSNPGTVIAVLRLEQLLNLDVFQELRQGSSEFSSLLDDIGKQFMTHADSNVLKAARDSLLHCQTAEDFTEVTDTKVEEVWADVLKPLQQAASSKKPNSGVLANAVQRVSTLASITDCVDLFERELPGKQRSSSPAARSIEEYLRTLLVAYQDGYDENAEQILLASIQALLLYTMWKVQRTKAELESGDDADWDLGYLTSALSSVIEARGKLDDVRLKAIGALLDAYTSQLCLRQIDTNDTNVVNTINGLVATIPADLKKSITASFVAAEKDFAKKTRRNLNTSNDDADLEQQGANGEADAPESEPESSDEEEEDDEQNKQHAAVWAERRLCELTGKIVLAVVGKVIDAEAPGKGKLRRRIQKNRTKLGPHYKEVVGYLEEPKAKGARGGNKAKTPAPANGSAAAKSAAQPKSKEVIVESDEEDEDEAQAPDGVEGDEQDLQEKGVAMNKEDEGDEEDEDEEDDDVMGD